MTVKELKLQLQDIPDDTVIIVFDSLAQVYVEVNSNQYTEDMLYVASDDVALVNKIIRDNKPVFIIGGD